MKWLRGNQKEIVGALQEDQRENTQNQTLYEERTKAILANVLANGDQALREYTKEFDQAHIENFLVSQEAIEAAYLRVEQEVIDALERAKDNINSYHTRQKQEAFIDSEKPGVIRGQLILPIEKVGVYVPGGTAAYPSSVLMNVLPAKIAGVSQVVMVTPPSPQGVPDVILAAAKIAGVDQVFQIGGAQAIAALAFGTESIPRVDKIVGPGNIYVATAKKLVFGTVGIDMIAGPSEIGVLADEAANPAFIAADLLSQAEHDVLARAVLVTNSETLGKAVEEEITKQLVTLPRREIAAQAIAEYGRIIIASTVTEMFDIMNEIAPEHLEIQMEDPMSYLNQVKHAGSIFLGAYASEPVGDYYAGANHVLPTSGTARFYSPLGVYDFIKHSQFIYYTKDALAKEQADITILARKEGLEGHARAIDIRFEEEV